MSIQMLRPLGVVGDRRYKDYLTFSKILKDELERYPTNTIVTGDAAGADSLARAYAIEHGLALSVYCASARNYIAFTEGSIPMDCHLASDWIKDGKAAGFIRNLRMAENVGRCLAFNGGGPGTANMIKTCEKIGIEVSIWNIDWVQELLVNS